MKIPQGIVELDIKCMKLADSISIASATLRGNGQEADAIALFRLRIKIREGLSYEEAKPIFDKHTKNILEENS